MSSVTARPLLSCSSLCSVENFAIPAVTHSARQSRVSYHPAAGFALARPNGFSGCRLLVKPARHSVEGIPRGIRVVAMAGKAAAVGDMAFINYTGKTDLGMFATTVPDEKVPTRKPFSFKLGDERVMADSMMRNFNNAVLGMRVGEKKSFSVPPSESYGARDPKLVLTLPASMLTDTLNVGDVTVLPGGRKAVLIEKNEATVVLDGNNPLSEKTLHFDIELMDLK